jgi:hypothetical protein
MNTDDKMSDARKKLAERFGKIERTGGSGSSRIVKKNVDVKKTESKQF